MVKKAKPLRADAERNRQHVLDVAHSVFAAEGLEVPIDEIARRAGLGVGTLYRHFPTKEALFEAIVVARMENVLAAARDLAGEKDAGKAFFRFLERLVQENAGKKDFIDALVRSGFDMQRTRSVKADVGKAFDKLLGRAQKARAVRSDVTVGEVFALVGGSFSSLDRLGAAPSARKRVFEIICDGLRVRTG